MTEILDRAPEVQGGSGGTRRIAGERRLCRRVAAGRSTASAEPFLVQALNVLQGHGDLASKAGVRSFVGDL